MTAKLRKKFVIVTASLLLVVFGLFFIANTAYNKYLNLNLLLRLLGYLYIELV